MNVKDFKQFYNRSKTMQIEVPKQRPLEIQVGDSIFIMPLEEVYRNLPHFKKYGTIPGDVYWQGKVLKLGERKAEVLNSRKDVPKMVVVIEWYYTYYDLVDMFGKNVVKALILCAGMTVAKKGDMTHQTWRDSGQLDISLQEQYLWVAIITQPIWRVSRKNEAPLSLEKIQVYLIKEWKKNKKMNAKLTRGQVEASGLFAGQVPPNFQSIIKGALESMGSADWMECPNCHSSHI
ncbi:hypothetical protein CPB84DRAFT_1747695 [Gymnopilus junonius]|uniref:Uncharacterized protein n=1 Tax=Gymnopilus junonius TaxID=109634 RepID=A0A9P5NNU5_GYMJU|nr:hypothetical protein CPB84DRAFT_1747695 [Gymnopilus junonius]